MSIPETVTRNSNGKLEKCFPVAFYVSPLLAGAAGRWLRCPEIQADLKAVDM